MQKRLQLCICENGKYLKNVVDYSKIVYRKTLVIMNVLSTNDANSISTNITCTTSINSNDKK